MAMWACPSSTAWDRKLDNLSTFLENLTHDLYVTRRAFDRCATTFARITCLLSTCCSLGQRSVQGALVDLKNALVRYWSNNFADGRRQDAIDLFLAHVDAKDVPVDDVADAEDGELDLLFCFLSFQVNLLESDHLFFSLNDDFFVVLSSGHLR